MVEDTEEDKTLSFPVTKKYEWAIRKRVLKHLKDKADGIVREAKSVGTPADDMVYVYQERKDILLFRDLVKLFARRLRKPGRLEHFFEMTDIRKGGDRLGKYVSKVIEYWEIRRVYEDYTAAEAFHHLTDRYMSSNNEQEIYESIVRSRKKNGRS